MLQATTTALTSCSLTRLHASCAGEAAHLVVRPGPVRVAAGVADVDEVLAGDAVGVDLDGIKHVLGIWVQATEGAKFWAGVCAELRNRGVRDVLIVCCDGLTGFPEAIEATWPQTTVQTCTVHLIRAAMRFVSYTDRKRVAAALQARSTPRPPSTPQRPSCSRSPSPTSARRTRPPWRPGRTPGSGSSRSWPSHPSCARIIYTTNSVESLNYQLRKIIKNRGHFPNDDAAIKLLWLAIRDIEDKRARQRAKEKGLPPTQRTAPGRLVEGAIVRAGKPPSAPSRWPTPTGSPATSPDALPPSMAILPAAPEESTWSARSASEDERRGHRQAVEDDQPRRKAHH